jgi:hypothetical protein
VVTLVGPQPDLSADGPPVHAGTSKPSPPLNPVAAFSRRCSLAEARRGLHARNCRCRPRYLQRRYARRCSDSCRCTPNGSCRMRSWRSVLDTAWLAQLDDQGSPGQFFCFRPCWHRPRKSNPATAHFGSTRSRIDWSPRRPVLWLDLSMGNAWGSDVGPRKYALCAAGGRAVRSFGARP